MALCWGPPNHGRVTKVAAFVQGFVNLLLLAGWLALIAAWAVLPSSEVDAWLRGVLGR